MAEWPTFVNRPSRPGAERPDQEGRRLDYDQKAVNRVAAIERAILRLHHPEQAQFVGVINAIELQVEAGAPILAVVHHLAEALLELARQRGLPSPLVAQLQKRLEQLQDYLGTQTAGPAP